MKCWILVILMASPTGFGTEKATKRTMPLTVDEIAVYKIVLRQYASKGHESLNITATTFPFDPTVPPDDLSDKDCLKGVQLNNLASIAHSFHDLSSEVLSNDRMKLVDPKEQVKVLASAWQKVEARGNGSRTSERELDDDLIREVSDGGWLCLSEIAFDKEHLFALVAYRYICGFLCGNGATVVLENVGGEWKAADRVCSRWIS